MINYYKRLIDIIVFYKVHSKKRTFFYFIIKTGIALYLFTYCLYAPLQEHTSTSSSLAFLYSLSFTES